MRQSHVIVFNTLLTTLAEASGMPESALQNSGLSNWWTSSLACCVLLPCSHQMIATADIAWNCVGSGC